MIPRMLAVVLVSVPLACTGCTSEAEPVVPPKPVFAPPKAAAPEPAPDVPVPPAVTELLTRGAAAYQTGMCSKCHGDLGKGGKRAPNLTDDTWMHCDGSEEGILGVLRSGVSKEQLIDDTRPYAMNPATNLVPDEDDLIALAAYVRSLGE